MPSINTSLLGKVQVKFPPLPTQHAIAATLSCLDDKIELNNKINANLEAQAQAIFKSWFVDFEPFQDGEFVDSELGKIPKGWRVVPLADVVSTTSGYSYKSTELQPSNTAMATIKNFGRKGGFKTEGFKEIIATGKIKPAQYAKQFDILVAHTDVTQNADIIGNAEMIMTMGAYNRIIFSLDLVKVHSCLSCLSNFVLASILQSPQFKNYSLGYVNGTTVLHLSKRAIPEYRIALPNDDTILDELDNLLEPLYRMMANNLAASATLAAIRDALLSKLMSGEIEVPVEV